MHLIKFLINSINFRQIYLQKYKTKIGEIKVNFPKSHTPSRRATIQVQVCVSENSYLIKLNTTEEPAF